MQTLALDMIIGEMMKKVASRSNSFLPWGGPDVLYTVQGVEETEHVAHDLKKSQ